MNAPPQLTPEGYFQEIIKLQLKKPKHWNWQLSTSRSSPHISLPIIQLYDCKGQLLVEAKDSRVQRQSWHSLDLKTKEIAEKGYKELGHLQRCRSDTVTEKNAAAYKQESKRTGTVLDDERKKLREKMLELAINRNSLSRNGYHLKKSKSDLLQIKEDCNFPENGQNPLQTTRSATNFQQKQPVRHRRSKSDDLFRRKLKYNEESIKRAEADGYRKFLTPNIPPSDDEDALIPPGGRKPRNTKTCDATVENVLLPNNASNIEISRFAHNRYKTRTSSAGTLIISEESFNNSHRRRQRQRRPGLDANKQDNLVPEESLRSETENGISAATTTVKPPHIRQPSDPINNAPLDHFPGRRRCESGSRERRSCSGGGAKKTERTRSENNTEERSKSKMKAAPTGLFYSQSDVFVFDGIFPREKCNNNNRNYIVQEPVTTPGSDSIVVEKSERKKRRKIRRHRSDDDASKSCGKEENARTKAHLVKERPRDFVVVGGGGGAGDSDLLQLVRRLSTADHVKMGANVSRHSSKGLSGRRSQSSGSICNGKGGRHTGDGKMCGSLPSYLDDHNSTGGCNNNHQDCEKPPPDEVHRIPPLGDGAPLHWKFSDNQTALCDQGYGSERSPEEEYPPPLPDHDSQCHHHLEPHACYPFITPESTFTVKLTKGSRGLGLSVTGGIDSGGSWPGLIRIKRLFPYQPASACGLLNVGDLILEANGITLTGLTNYEALAVLRTAPNQVELKVCRPPPDVLSCVSPISEVPPPPPRREPPASLNLPSGVYSTPEDDYYHGEFEIKLTKIQGSLGFTLRKEDDSPLGCYVRALVREPALTDGRIRAGDKIIAVNDIEIFPMSHEQAVQFLRQCGDVVKLRLYRDSAQTPVAALSPTETTPRASFSKKAHLRQEAVDMLNDITYRRSASPTASPRTLRRQPCSSDASQIIDSSIKYIINDEQFHEGLLQKCSHPFDDENFSLFTIDSDEDRPSRPSSLDLYNPNQTPVASRKPRFNFSLAHNAYELNNLDPDVLDAPNLTYTLGTDDVKSTEVECGDSFPQEPASMPHIPSDNPGFSYKNPAYQSAHPQCGTEAECTAAKPPNMKKWKGVMFDGAEDKDSHHPFREEYEVLAIELNRGWNSRLGFSLQGAAGVTYVSAVHPDSVAAKDGRLKPGDRVIKVNDESVEHMTTNEIIDLLRIVRGPVCIVISRIKTKEDCPKSNAEN